MPTNLPPEYFEADQRFRAAKTPAEKIVCLEDLLGTIPKHKGTDKLRADLRRRLSKLKTESQTKKGASKQASVFHIPKEGAGQVVIVGTPNIGKSAIVATLTNATPEVAAFPYTTWKPTPGMMPFEDIQIQLVDTPPLNSEFIEPELFTLIRQADIIMLVVDVQTDPVQQFEDTLKFLEERRIAPLCLKDRYPQDSGLTFLPCVVVATKDDDERSDDNVEIFRQLIEATWDFLPISTTTGRHLERLKQTLFERLDIIRVYSKIPHKEADFTAPFILKKGSTVEAFAAKVHQDFVKHLKTARIWGSGVFDGQMVQRDHILQDRDIVELHM